MATVETPDRVLPWETVGNKTKAKTVKTALKQADLDWTVSKQPAGYFKDGKWVEVPDRFYVTRDDNGVALGEVSKSYVPLQTEDAFNFFDEVVSTGDVEYDTVGQTGEGKTVWVTARVPDELLIDGKDPVNLYLLLRTSHDGSSSVNLALTPVRAFCANTLTLAFREAKDRWNVRHVSGVEDRVQQAQETLGFSAKYADEFFKSATKLAQEPMSDAQFKTFVDKFTKELDLGERAIEDLKTRTREIFNDEPNLDNIRGSRWAAFNSVVDYYQWDRPRNETARLSMAWQYGRSLQRRALSLLN